MTLVMAVRRLSSSMDKPIKHLQNGGSLYCMWPKQLNTLLDAIADIIELKKARQLKGHQLILSENFTSVSVTTNK